MAKGAWTARSNLQRAGGRAFLIKEQDQAAAHTLLLTAAAANTHAQGRVKGLHAGVTVCSMYGCAGFPGVEGY